MAEELKAGTIVSFVFICLGLLVFFTTLICCWSRRKDSDSVRMILGISWCMGSVVTLPLTIIWNICVTSYRMVKKGFFIAYMRYLNALLCAVLGGFAAYNAAALTRRRPPEYIEGWDRWTASCLIGTIIGWIWFSFSLLSLCFIRQVWVWRPHGFPWWFLLMDAVAAACLIAAMAVVPLEQALIPVSQCGAKAEKFAMFHSAASALGMSRAHACRYLVTTYALEMAVTILCCLLFLTHLPATYSLRPIFPIRLMRRQIAKLKAARGQLNASNISSYLQLSQFPPSTTLLTTKQSALARVLGKGPVAARIASNLHYIDIVNLGSTSRKMHQALFSTNSASVSTRFELLHLSSCTSGSKKECWGCTRQICEGCQTQKEMPLSTADYHLYCCVAFCTRCAAAKTYPAILGHYIACPVNYLKTNAYHKLNSEVQVCHDCNAETTEEAVARRNKRDLRNIQKLVKVNGPQCHSCAKDLTAHVPWWACSQCGMECEWEGHFADK